MRGLTTVSLKVSAELVKEQNKKDAKAKRAAAPTPPPRVDMAKAPNPAELAPKDPEATSLGSDGSEKDSNILHTVSSSVSSSVTAVSSSVSVVTSSVQDAKDNLQEFLAKKGILGTYPCSL